MVKYKTQDKVSDAPLHGITCNTAHTNKQNYEACFLSVISAIKISDI